MLSKQFFFLPTNRELKKKLLKNCMSLCSKEYLIFNIISFFFYSNSSSSLIIQTFA